MDYILEFDHSVNFIKKVNYYQTYKKWSFLINYLVLIENIV